MVLQKTLSLIAGVIFFAGYIPYIYSILRGKTRPVKATWVIWAALDTTTAMAMFFSGALNGQIIGAIAGAYVVVVLALMRYGLPGWTSTDKFCLVGTVAALLLWVTSGSPRVGIACSITVLILGAIPTVIQTFHNPETEDKLTWIFWSTSCVIALIAVPQWDLANAAQPLAFTAIDVTILSIILHRCRKN